MEECVHSVTIVQITFVQLTVVQLTIVQLTEVRHPRCVNQIKNYTADARSQNTTIYIYIYIYQTMVTANNYML
jgi:hypothetical protein